MAEENYVTFNDYNVTTRKVLSKKEVRLYGTPTLGDVNNAAMSLTSTLFNGAPFRFVTVIKVGLSTDQTDYFQLRNDKNEVVFTTDQEGLDTLYGGIKDPGNEDIRFPAGGGIMLPKMGFETPVS
jgi:hypothetical protein